MQPYSATISKLYRQPSQRGWLRAGLLTGAVVLATMLPTAAVPLLPGGSTPLSGTPSAGTVIRDPLLPFEIHNSSKQLLISGNLQDRVVRVADTGDLVFMPRLRDMTRTAAGAGFSIVGLKVTGYDDCTTDVEWKSDGAGTVGPSTASRDISGDEVTFLYPFGALVPPSESRFPIVETNAPAFHLAGRITITVRNAALQTFSATLQGTAAPTRLQVYPGGIIQAAIDAASPGETVLVHPGTYTESITLRSGIDVKGESAGLVTLRAPADPGVTITNCTNTEFSGFTVIPATGGAALIGIHANGGSPLVKNNIVTGFSREGIYLTNGCNAIVCGNRILDNGDSGNGTLDYGILCLSSKPLIANNLISGNECGCYIAWHESDGAQFVNNTVVDNSSDGLWCYRSNPVVKNNIVTGNNPGISASFENATPVLTYNNVWNNSGFGNYSSQQTGVINIGTGSISVDPIFDPGGWGLYRLADTSPCRDAGDPAFVYNDLDGSRNDMGWTGGPCASPEVSAAPFGGFLFTSVGNIPASYIAANGLATVPADDATALQIPAWDHAPFGSKPYLFGVFGSGVSPSYYHIEYKLAGAPVGDFTPLDHPLSKVRYTITPTGITAAVISVGPFFNDGVPFYQVTNNGGTTYWAHDTLKLILNSHQLPDGTYNFRLKAFTGGLSGITLTGPANGLTLAINNQRPTVEIISIARASGTLLSECGIVGLTGPQENLGFRITASHADGYLDDYALSALVGRNRYAGIITSDSYANHNGSIAWTGVTNALFGTLPAMTAVPPRLAPWESCAYQFRLGAWARTTNGYHRIYYSEFFWNVALNLNGADLDGDGDVDGDDLNIFADAYGSSNN